MRERVSLPERNKLQAYFSAFTDLLFPKLCLYCRCRFHEPKSQLCEDCKSRLSFLKDDICEICGTPKQGAECQSCQSYDYSFDKARSVFRFTPVVQACIHRLKYHGTIGISTFLAAYAVDYLRSEKPFDKIDIIAPVPLHSTRQRERGFNQAEKLSRHIAAAMGYDHKPKLLFRKKFTQTQTKLSKAEREKNVAAAFGINPKNNITDKSILIVDDVFTTGSTVNAISKLLKSNNVSQIYILTIAHA